MKSARQDHENSVRQKLSERDLTSTERAERRKQYNLEYVEFRNGPVHVDDLPDKAVTPEDLKGISMTTYAREKLPPKMTDETLIAVARKYASQVTQMHQPAVTYEEMLIHNIMPEIINRLEDK